MPKMMNFNRHSYLIDCANLSTLQFKLGEATPRQNQFLPELCQRMEVKLGEFMQNLCEVLRAAHGRLLTQPPLRMPVIAKHFR